MNKDDIQKFLKENADLFQDLAESLLCPGCDKVVRPPFHNLGEKYHWAEGCKECYENT